MNTADFDYLSALLKERSGLVVTPDKLYLLESRLTPIARDVGLEDLEALITRMKAAPDEKLNDLIVEAMTTNESYFFRDDKPFKIFEAETLPDLLKQNADSKTLRIWSAAASTGQEPYSLAMILDQKGAALAGWRIEIVGTDLSKKVLDKAKAGLYSQFEVQRGLPVQMMVQYFEQVDEKWQISQKIKKMVEFRQFNLLNSYAGLGKFDVIFCRNVLIYFDAATKSDVLNRMGNQLNPGGALYLGGTETVLGITERFKPKPGLRGVYAQAA